MPSLRRVTFPIERIVWDFTGYNSTDLEASTKTITATSKQATPDYTYNIPAGATRLVPPDARFTPKRFCGDIEVTIDSMTATHLYCSVEFDDVEVIDGTTADFTESGANQRERKDSTNAAHLDGVTTAKIYFWVDAGDAVLSLVTVRYGYGTGDAAFRLIMELGSFNGFVSVAVNLTGPSGSYLLPTLSDPFLLGSCGIKNMTTVGCGHGDTHCRCKGKVYLWMLSGADAFVYSNAIEIMYQRV